MQSPRSFTAGLTVGYVRKRTQKRGIINSKDDLYPCPERTRALRLSSLHLLVAPLASELSFHYPLCDRQDGSTAIREGWKRRKTDRHSSPLVLQQQQQTSSSSFPKSPRTVIHAPSDRTNSSCYWSFIALHHRIATRHRPPVIVSRVRTTGGAAGAPPGKQLTRHPGWLAESS